MNAEDLKRRTKQFALRVIRLVNHLPQNRTANVIANQILRSATSVGANYRAAARAGSPKEFIAKLGIVIEECDETLTRTSQKQKVKLVYSKLSCTKIRNYWLGTILARINCGG